MAVKATIVKAARRLNMAIFVKVLGVAAFCVLYLTLVSALPFNAAYYAVLPLGMAITAVLLVFFDKK